MLASTGRSALAACSASLAPTGGRTAARSRRVLIEQLKAGEKTAHGLRIVLEAGRNEPLIFRANQAIYAELQHTATGYLASG
jgi:enterochelin esterase-like enzyme